MNESTALQWSVTTGGAYVCGPYLIAERVDDRGWNASKSNETLVLADTLERCKKACEKDAATPHPEALRLADALEATDYYEDLHEEAAAELRRLHAENETPRQQPAFDALVAISLLTHLGGEVADYEDVVEAVRRLHALNGELLEVAKLALRMGVYGGVSPSTVEDAARAAIAKVEGK